MSSSKERSKPKVAYLGPAASYSHQAALACFSSEDHVFVAHNSIRDTFTAVQESSSSFAVVPFENSTYGTVVFTLDLLVDRESAYPNLLVCGEYYLPICHSLLGHPSEGQPQNLPREGSNSGQLHRNRYGLQHISTVYSHPQALGQCEHFLSQNLQGAERREISSTSKAAETVAGEGPNSRAAAISSSLAAGMYGLTVLAEGIQDKDDNSTRFFVLRKQGTDSKSYVSPPHQSLSTDKGGWKTLISFTLPQQPSGTLADVLEVFKDHDLNLTGIHSRPSLQLPWHYVFLIEVQGRREASGHGVLNQALEEMQPKTREWRWLGSWIEQRVKPAQLRR